MKTQNLKNHPLAILTAQSQKNLAVLTADLSAEENGWFQLLPPAGKFKARDGRPMTPLMAIRI